MSNVLVPLADGFEDIEAITVIDVLRRAGVQVTTASVSPEREAHSSHGIGVATDQTLTEAMDGAYDMIVLPGGLPGADTLKKDPRIRSLLQTMNREGKHIAAICAAPAVLADAGLLQGRTATSYPGCLSQWQDAGVSLREAPVVADGKIITSRGPGTAMDFALALVEALLGNDKRSEVAAALLAPTAAAGPPGHGAAIA